MPVLLFVCGIKKNRWEGQTKIAMLRNVDILRANSK